MIRIILFILVATSFAAPQLKPKSVSETELERLLSEPWENRPWLVLDKQMTEWSVDQTLEVGRLMSKIMHKKWHEEFQTLWDEYDNGNRQGPIPDRKYLSGTLWYFKWVEKNDFVNWDKPPRDTWEPK